MDIEKEALFKSVPFGGFRKEDVLDYLENVDIQHTREIEDLRKNIERINNERNHYAGQIQNCDAEITRLQNQLQSMANQLQIQNDVIAAQDAEINMYRKTIQEKEKDLSLQSDSIKELSFQNEALLYKSQQFDAMTEATQDSYYEVKRHADYYLQDLDDRNKAIAHKSRQHAKQLDQRVNATLTSLEELKTHMTDVCDALNKHLGGVASSIEGMGKLMALDEETGETEYTTYLAEKQVQMKEAVENFIASEKAALRPPAPKEFPKEQPKVTFFQMESEPLDVKESPKIIASAEENVPTFTIPPQNVVPAKTPRPVDSTNEEESVISYNLDTHSLSPKNGATISQTESSTLPKKVPNEPTP